MTQTLFDKLWELHEIASLDEGESLLAIDRVFLHERTGSIALTSMAEEGRPVRDPTRVFCTMDHIVDTFPGRGDETLMPGGKEFILETRKAAREAGIHLFDIDDPRQGIMHVVSPELGIAQPGLTVVCPDSHSCTLGGIGALAWGIGSTEAQHAMVTGTLRVTRPRNLRVHFRGQCPPDVTAKDMILHLIGLHGADGGNGYAVEFTGDAIRNLDIEERVTLCNMAEEFSAFTGLVAPDERTVVWCRGRPFGPASSRQAAAEEHWRSLTSDPEARFDRLIEVDAQKIRPAVTWGTSPQHTVALDGQIPDPASAGNPDQARAMERALAYMDLAPGSAIADIPIDAAFIGSCTNARLSDLRLAAAWLKGRRVAPGVRAVVVPGSSTVKRDAEAEGLDQIFINAGFEWRESGCSMCLYAGGETFGPGARVVSSTNRNFEGRQGPGTRTHLASPLTVVASACAGRLSAAEWPTAKSA